MRIGVLGPLTATRGGAALGLPRGRAAVMLTVLAMFAGHSVSASRLARLIWAEEQPVRVRPSLQTLAARLRTAMPGVIVTTGDGYLLDIDPGHVDLLLFRRLVSEASQTADDAAARNLLDQALQLWRGEPLAGLQSAALDRELAPGLTDELLSAVQQRAEFDLAAGRLDRVIAELRGLTAEYPLREPLWEQLLRALIGAGRPAEAIAEYHRAREILAAELGVDPSAELKELYQQLLHADGHPPAGRDMRDAQSAFQPGEAGLDAGQMRGGGAVLGDGSAGDMRYRLPADTRAFTGRLAELTRLAELGEAADGSAGTGTVVISAIDGMAGIGKTALAVHVAHRLAERFGDGQLFIDLHGYTQGYPPRTAGQALETLLRTLGVPARQIPDETEERAALYRAKLAGTRTLIVLDNAADEAQVRPLIPGAAGCLVLVTSRRKLKGLDDAHTIALDALPGPDAIALFCAVAGKDRVAADDPAVAQIADLCGRLPLAVRIAASLLRNRPTWRLGHLMDRLQAARTALDALGDGDRNVAAVFDLSCQALDEDQQRLYRHLGPIPGPEVDAYAAAALLGTDPATAERLLQDLVDHNLLLEPARGRYCMHDLIRTNSCALAMLGAETVREAALGRLLDYYQHIARLADAQIARYPHAGSTAAGPGYGPALRDADMARAWLRTERANLAACFQHAVQRGDDNHTVGLSVGLASLLRTDGPWPQAISVHTATAAAAARLGNLQAQARALTERGDLRRLTGDYPGADHDLREALDLWRETGDKPGQARTLLVVGTVRRLTGDHTAADRHVHAALTLYREADDKLGQARTLMELGTVRYTVGDYPGAQAGLRAALDLYVKAGEKSGQARALTELVEVQVLTGEYEAATRNGEAALVIANELGDRLRQAHALMELAHVQRFTVDYGSAARNTKAALDLYRELGYRLGQANALTQTGEILHLTGDCEGAVREMEESLRIYREIGSRGGQAWALNYYAAAISATGDLTRATALYRDALDLAREVHQPDDEAAALEGLGDTHLRTGNFGDGAAYLNQALEIYQWLGMAATERVCTRLAEIGLSRLARSCVS